MAREGQKGRKIGRATRKPAHKRYISEQRWVKNKERKIAKQKRLEEKKRLKKQSY
jgi:hypothetical protein